MWIWYKYFRIQTQLNVTKFWYVSLFHWLLFVRYANLFTYTLNWLKYLHYIRNTFNIILHIYKNVCNQKLTCWRPFVEAVRVWEFYSNDLCLISKFETKTSEIWVLTSEVELMLGPYKNNERKKTLYRKSRKPLFNTEWIKYNFLWL